VSEKFFSFEDMKQKMTFNLHTHAYYSDKCWWHSEVDDILGEECIIYM